MNQQEKILAILQERPITPMEALNECGCFRLASVIHRLREKGYIIRTDEVKSKETGNYYAQYTLTGEFKHGEANRNETTHQAAQGNY